MENVTLKPAINATKTGENQNDQMSQQEFQNTLYYWFNQKGLVASMRSYLRMKMINELKNTYIGESTKACCRNEIMSMENQAINILIADYLFQNQYEYSLSVFSTEIPIKTLVAEFCFSIFNNKNKNGKKEHKLNEENVVCILESFGLSRNSPVSNDITEYYRSKEKATLIFSILKMMIHYWQVYCKNSKNDNLNEPNFRNVKNNVMVDSEHTQIEDLGKFVNKILLHFEVPPKTVSHLIEKVNEIIADQVNVALRKCSKHYDEEIHRLKTDTIVREKDFKHKLINIDKYLRIENEKMDKEKSKIVAVKDTLKMTERRLHDKTSELEEKIRKFNEKEAKFLELNKIQKLRKISTMSAHPTNNSPTAGEPCNLKHCDGICETNRSLVDSLLMEKTGLERVSENQKILIENLTSRSNVLYSELQKALVTIQDLNLKLRKKKEVEGEKIASISNSEMLSSPIVSDDDATDEVIKQSHLKLQQLEKESEEIDKKFKQFQITFRQSMA